MSPPPLFHVGYHKTATTWLQNVVFKPENGFPPLLDHPEIFELIVHPHGLLFDPGPVRRMLAERRAKMPEGSVGVLSLEALSGNPLFGGRESDDYARRLKEIAPDARILLTVREQIRLIASVYMQYLLRGGTQPPRRFFAGEPVGGYFGFDPAHFEYHRLVGLYQELFGAENVLVLPLETIAADQEAAVRLLARFAGNTRLAEKGWTQRRAHGRSHPEAAAPLLRRINHIRPGPMNRSPLWDGGRFAAALYRAAGGGIRRWGRSDARPVQAVAREMFAGRFAESNCALAGSLHHPVDLSAYEGLGRPKEAGAGPQQPPLAGTG